MITAEEISQARSAASAARRRLVEVLEESLGQDPALLASMGERARSVGVRDAADRIAALAERCARRPQ